MSKVKSQKFGFTLIEMLVFLFIFSLIITTFYSVWTSGTRYILLVKNRLVASSLANEKMEVAKNLTFEDIALTTGDPSGNLLQNEDVTRMGRIFYVFTQIKNQDDPFDGECNETDTSDCLAPVDYKEVKVTVSWGDATESIVVSSRFVPAGIEQPDPTRGVLVVNVSSDKDNGALVPQSSVRIRNTETGLDETHSTNNFGHLLLTGLKETTSKYEITLEKEGWETVTTFASYPEGPYNPPVHENPSVRALAVNELEMFQNELANFSVETKDYLGESIANIDYHLKGGKKLGLDESGILDVFNVDSDFVTDSSGQRNHSFISPGVYNFELMESGYKVIGIDPVEKIVDPVMSFTLVSGSSNNLSVKVASESVTSLLIRIQDDDGGPSVAGAQVHITNGSDYDESLITDSDGMAFFPISEDPPSPPFASGTYNVSVTADGFSDYSGQVSVNANELKEEIIVLIIP